MLNDKELMVTGSTSYLCMNNNELTTIPKNYEVKLNNVSLKKNIDLGYVNVPYYVREEGIYILFFVINSNQASQFSFYVNGLEQPLTRYGNNSGAGQLILRTMLKLKNLSAIVDTTPVLTDINLEVNPGEIHAIMGPHGSGKSCLAHCIQGNPFITQIDGDILEVPITFIERKYGVSKMSKRIVFEAIYRVTAWGIGAKFRGKRP